MDQDVGNGCVGVVWGLGLFVRASEIHRFIAKYGLYTACDCVVGCFVSLVASDGVYAGQGRWEDAIATQV